MKVFGLILLVALQIVSISAEKPPMECTPQVARVLGFTFCQFVDQSSEQKDVTKISVIPTMFQGQYIDSSSVTGILISSSHFDNIPSAIYKNFGVIKRLQITYSDIKNIDRDDFSAGTDLTHIEISSTTINKISSKAFELLKNLEEVKIQKCNIAYFMADAFDGLENLKTVILNENSYIKGRPTFTNTNIKFVYE